MKFVETCYRAHNPRWAYKPTSGEGARIHGGRFNPAGLPALYLSLTPVGAMKEAAQAFLRKFDPCVMVSYDVDCDDVLDLTDDATRLANAVTVSDLNCAWRNFLLVGSTPPSWAMAKRLIASGIAGIVVPSYVTGATSEEKNLVLWNWGKDLPHQIAAYDPNNLLPKNQLSWD